MRQLRAFTVANEVHGGVLVVVAGAFTQFVSSLCLVCLCDPDEEGGALSCCLAPGECAEMMCVTLNSFK